MHILHGKSGKSFWNKKFDANYSLANEQKLNVALIFFAKNFCSPEKFSYTNFFIHQKKCDATHMEWEQRKVLALKFAKKPQHDMQHLTNSGLSDVGWF